MSEHEVIINYIIENLPGYKCHTSGTDIIHGETTIKNNFYTINPNRPLLPADFHQNKLLINATHLDIADPDFFQKLNKILQHYAKPDTIPMLPEQKTILDYINKNLGSTTEHFDTLQGKHTYRATLEWHSHKPNTQWWAPYQTIIIITPTDMRIQGIKKDLQFADPTFFEQIDKWIQYLKTKF